MTSDTARWRSAGRFLPAVLLLVVVALVIAAVVLGLRLWEARQAESVRTEAMQAARQESVNLYTLDYNTIDKNIANVLAGATGDFHDQYAKGAAQFKKAVTDNKVRSDATVLEAGVVSADTDSVTVLVVLDSTVRNNADQKGQLKHFRMQLEMSKVDGRWRARSLEFISL